MRISGGEKKGIKLKGPKKRDIRPTTSIVKEYIFGLIGEFIIDKKVLDLFAGTGNLGIEAISRGAEFVSFVDISQHSVHLIIENLKKAGFEKYAKVHKTDIFKFFSRKKENEYDIVLADPPFAYKELYKLCKSEKLLKIIKEDGYFIIEHYPEIKEGFYHNGFQLIKFRSFGGNKISIFKKV